MLCVFFSWQRSGLPDKRKGSQASAPTTIAQACVMLRVVYLLFTS